MRTAVLATVRTALRDRLCVRLLLLYAALNLADAATTYIGLQRGAVEGSPLYAHLFAHPPFVLVVGIKLTFAAVLAAYVLLVQYSWRRVAGIIELSAMSGLMALVVANNVWALVGRL